MRESYREKQNRKARIAREKEKKEFEKKGKKSFATRENQRDFQRNKGSQSIRTNRNNQEFRNQVEEKDYEDVVAGRNAVLELLKSDKDINKIFIERGEKHGSINEIIAKAKDAKIVLVEVDRSKLDTMAENHQGVVAIVPPFNYCEVEDILEEAKNKNEDPFIIILDGIEDPHNLGSIIRTAETAGVHGIIIPKRRAAQVNSTVSKVASGALAYMKIARVNNITDTITKLKDKGVWVCGPAIDAEIYSYDQNLTGPIAIVIGNEGKGMGELVKRNCDFLVKIPMKGKVTSLNASVSTGIIVYEAVKQRN